MFNAEKPFVGLNLLKDPHALRRRVLRILHENGIQENYFPQGISRLPGTSAVLFIIGRSCGTKGSSAETCLILSKRSSKVKQAGDLCCPGGSISARLDSYFAGLLHLPGSPLKRWPYWPYWRKHRRRQSRSLALLFAAGLRESFEEMRLNPIKVKLLGPLPPQRLVMFDRSIYPLVCWVSAKQRFLPNWEVEKVVFIPISALLDSSNYACYRLHIRIPDDSGNDSHTRDWPCFLHKTEDETEILWGATYRVAMVFLKMVFGYDPPEMLSLPVVHGTLNADYLTGNN